MKKQSAKDYKKLSQQIADLMANLDCPVTLFNNLADILTDFSNHLDWHTPEMIEQSLLAYDRSESNSPKVPRDDAGYVIFQERE